MQCARCGANLAPEDRFCTRCGTPVSVGTPVEVVCAHCGNKLGSGDRFCLVCGTPRPAGQTLPASRGFGAPATLRDAPPMPPPPPADRAAMGGPLPYVQPEPAMVPLPPASASASPRQRNAAPIWVVGSAVLVVAALVLAGVLILRVPALSARVAGILPFVRPKATPLPTPTTLVATAAPSAAEPTMTPTAEPGTPTRVTPTAEPETPTRVTPTADGDALATGTAVARAAAGTAVAEAMETVTVQVQATLTALALAGEVVQTQVAATAQAQNTAQAQATQSAQGTATAEAASTAQAQTTANAQGTAQAAATDAAAKTATVAAAPTPTATLAPRPGLVLDFERALTWRRGDQPYGDLQRSGEQVKAGSSAGRLQYRFPAVSDNFVVFLAQPAVALSGQPTGLVAWVYGNGSGHFLNVWVQDAAGEIRQYTFGRLTHQGWQQMISWFDERRGWPNTHVDGPDNGKLDYPVRLHAVVLDSVPHGQASEGMIFLDEVFTTQQPIPEPASEPTATPKPAYPNQ